MSRQDSNKTVYVVRCEDCSLAEVYDSKNPPSGEVSIWGSVAKASKNWSAKSAAKGKRDNHQQSAFRDYDEGLRHRPYIVETTRPLETEILD